MYILCFDKNDAVGLFRLLESRCNLYKLFIEFTLGGYSKIETNLILHDRKID